MITFLAHASLAVGQATPDECNRAASATSVTVLEPHPSISAAHTMTKVVFAKYWSKTEDGATSTEASTYYVFRPATQAAAVPVVVEYHGGGFTGGSASGGLNPLIDATLSNGIALASMDYRLVATKYFFGAGDAVCEEEFIHADRTGRLWRDTHGAVASDYQVRVGRQEFNTKCSFDAAAGFDDLVNRSASLGIDPHRVAFTGGSAGGGEIHYLSWVYRALDENWRRFTPRAMVYTNAQLDYPVQNILDRVWGLWADDVGNETLLTDILAQDYADCEMCVGNPWCGATGRRAQTRLCNASWHAATMARYCGAAGEKMAGITLGQLRRTQRWPTATEHDRGLARLWYASENIAAARALPPLASTPFYLYVANQLNGTAGMNVVHNALYARRYAQVAAAAGLEYVTYYPDYHKMRPSDRAPRRLGIAGGTVLNLQQSFDWRRVPGVPATAPASAQEQALFYCHAFNLSGCSASPPPPPPPPLGPLSAACEAEVRKDCPVAPAGCVSCVHAHAGELMAAGCPKGPGAAQQVITYCETLAGLRRAGALA